MQTYVYKNLYSSNVDKIRNINGRNLHNKKRVYAIKAVQNLKL